jgi:glycosyltransferase involved in cell wall biosynthesis
VTGPDDQPVWDLVIPAFNERPNLEPLFAALADLGPARPRHIAVGDNGSTDGTAEYARSLGALVAVEPRRGYGSACLAALRALRHEDTPPDVVAFLDADLSDDPAELPRLVAEVRPGHADLALGNRLRRAEPGALSLPQRFGSRLACAMIRILTGRRFDDLGPLRAIRWETLERLRMRDPDWGWTVEMQMKAALVGLRWIELDVPYRCRARGSSKISKTLRGVWLAGTKIIATILVLWLRRHTIRRDARIAAKAAHEVSL